MSRTGIFKYLFLFVIGSLLASCVTNRKTQYLQEVDNERIPGYSKVELEYYKIQPGDELYIQLTPFDPEVREVFNMDQSRTTTSGDIEAILNLQSYPVYQDGNIDFPIIGKVQMAGLTVRDARSKMDSLLIGKLFSDGEVKVKLINNYVSLVGDVKKPGKYIIYKENLNIFQALALGGDIATFGDRSEVRIVRHTPDQILVKTFDLRSEEILSSEFYFIQPNDVIYVRRIKGQFFGMDSFTDFVSLVSGSLSVLALSLTIMASN